MNTSHKTRRPALVLATALAAAAILAACGGSDDNHGGPIAGGPGSGDPAPVDPFLAAVQGQVSLSAETTGEPINIDNIAVTSSEDKEPIAI